MIIKLVDDKLNEHFSIFVDMGPLYCQCGSIATDDKYLFLKYKFDKILNGYKRQYINGSKNIAEIERQCIEEVILKLEYFCKTEYEENGLKYYVKKVYKK